MSVKLTRRSFLQGASALAISCAAPARAWIHGSVPTFGKSVLNEDFRAGKYMNLIKGLSFTSAKSPFSSFNNDGYPTGVLPGDYSALVAVAPNYYGHYTFSWTGTGAFVQDILLPVLIYSGGVNVFSITPSSSGFINGGPTIYNTSGNVNVEMTFGTLITGVAQVGGLLSFSTTTGFASRLPSGSLVQFENISGLPIGPNSDGSWTITNVDNQTFTLNGSTGLSLPTLTGGGNVGTNTAVIVSIPEGVFQSCHFPQSIPGIGSITYAMSNFVWCKTTSAADIALGYQLTRTIINTVIALKPRYIRYMDAQAAQANYALFGFLAPSTSLSYDGIVWNSALQGTDSGTSSAYQITNPSASGSGAYADGETVQFTATHTSVINPTLQLAARGAAPIFLNSSQTIDPHIDMPVTGSVTNGDTITCTFTASYLPSGARTIVYTVNTSVNGPSGQPDNSLGNFQNNLYYFLSRDPVLAAAGIIFANLGLTYQPSKGALTVSITSSGTEVVTPTWLAAGAIVSGQSYTLIYNVMLAGWLYLTSGSGGNALFVGIPLSIVKEYSTRCNVGAWFNMSAFYTAASAQSLGQWAALNLGSVPVAIEYSNEVWNTAQKPYSNVKGLALAMGFNGANGGVVNDGVYGMYGLKVAQLMQKFATGYMGGGGTRGNLRCVLGDWVLNGINTSFSATLPFRLNGGFCTPTPGSFTGTISGTVLTVSGISGYIYPGWTVAGAGITAGTKIVRDAAAVFVGAIAATTLTVASVTSGALAIGQAINGASAGTIITGGSGLSWTVNKSQTLGSGTYATYGDPNVNSNGTYIVDTSQTVGPVSMTVSNPVYSAIGGFDGASTLTAYNAYPTRPVDFADALSYATYFFGALVSDGVQNPAVVWTGAQSLYETPINIFQAAADYASGNATLMNNALNVWDGDLNNGTINGTKPVASTIATFTGNTYPFNLISGWETIASSYDGNGANQRPVGKANLGVMWYEGSIQQGPNGGDTTPGASGAGTLATVFTNNGWSLGAYGSSNLDVAEKLNNLFIAYCHSTQYYNTVLNYWNVAKTIHAARPFFSPAQYGIEGPGGGGVPLWGLFEGDPHTTALQNFYAEQYYNTH